MGGVQFTRTTRMNQTTGVGLGGPGRIYEQYLERKYGHGTKGLSTEQITEQFVNLSRCKRDKAMFQQLLDYLALLENYRKAA